MAEPLYVYEDNLIEWEGLQRASTDAYVNDATLTMTCYKQIATDGAMTSGAATLTCATSAPFVSGDAGRRIIVHGAGTGGSDLRTTISSFTSSSIVTLAANAGATKTGGTVEMSLDNASGVSLTYVTGSDGDYQGVLDKAVPLVDGSTYILEVIAADGSNDGLRRETHEAQYHGASSAEYP